VSPFFEVEIAEQAVVVAVAMKAAVFPHSRVSVTPRRRSAAWTWPLPAAVLIAAGRPAQAACSRAVSFTSVGQVMPITAVFPDRRGTDRKRCFFAAL
jgi:hypothetical protein